MDTIVGSITYGPFVPPAPTAVAKIAVGPVNETTMQ